MNFDRLAPHYTWMEAVTSGRLLQRARTTWLDALAGCRDVLTVGEGHGKFATAFGQRFPDASLTCAEASPRMLAVAKRRTRNAGVSAHWLHVVVPDWTPPPQRYDAIVTTFFLDCFPPDELTRVISVLAEGATTNAVWLVTDFAVPAQGFRHWRARVIHALMYAFFRAATGLPARRLTAPDDRLRSHGFRLVHRREFSLGLIRADVWQR